VEDVGFPRWEWIGEKPAPTRSIIIFTAIKIQKEKGKRKGNIRKKQKKRNNNMK
jgi:hypothetical protein